MTLTRIIEKRGRKIQAFRTDHHNKRLMLVLSFLKLHEIVKSTKNSPSERRTELLYTLLKYQKIFTLKPGVCTSFTYKFEVTESGPIRPSNPIHFSIRPAVDEQIYQMLKDRIREPSHSLFSSLLLVVFFFYLVCEPIGTAATTGLFCQPQVIGKMIVEKQMECRLARETEVLGENLPQRHFCPSQNST
jgi:hypothetical protein